MRFMNVLGHAVLLLSACATGAATKIDHAQAAATGTAAQASADQTPTGIPAAAMQRYRAGNELLLAGDCTAAIPEFEAARDLHPIYAKVYEGLGVCYGSLGKNAEAVAAYERYLELEPGAADAGKVRQILSSLRDGENTAPR